LKKNKRNFDIFHSQLELPFLETYYEFLEEIFQTLESKFGLKKNSNQKFVDLGAGNGKVVIYTALNYNIKSYGFEINQNLTNEAEIKIKSLKKEGNYKKKLLRKMKIKLGDFFLLNLKDYDFIYIFSLPSMQKFLTHIFNTVKKGTIIISHKYPLVGFNSILKYEYRLAHKNDKQEICTFFYKNIL